MAGNSAAHHSRGPLSWSGWGSCLLGGVIAFAWIPGTQWEKLLPSFRALIFLPLFGSAFAAGWLVGLLRLKAGQAEQEGAIRSQASITGFLTALVACLAAHAASGNARLPLEVAAMLTCFGLLPCALLATVGAGFAHRIKERSVNAVAASAALPAAAVLIWPTVYVAGTFLGKPPAAVAPATATPLSAPTPRPLYVKPSGFDESRAWSRAVIREDVVADLAGGSPLALSHGGTQVALVRRAGGVHHLTARHLYDPGRDLAAPAPGPIPLLAWSPDDERIVALDHRGAFSVWDLREGALIPLPIPKVDPGDVAGIVWWQPEDVLVLARGGEPQVLSLDTLRLAPASRHPGWIVLLRERQASIVREAEPPPLHAGDRVRHALAKWGDARTLMAHDATALYGRALLSGLPDTGRAFSNRDGSVLFLAEPERLRILYIGLRDAPTLRFAVASRDDFPTGEAPDAAVTERAIECVVCPPIINPLNGKTVAGDVERAKGLARVIAAEGKAATVWVSEEREPITTGDVVTLPRDSRARGALLSPEWFGVLEKGDASQDIPRREAEKPPPSPAAASSAARSPTTFPSPPPAPEPLPAPAKAAAASPQPVPLPVQPAAPPAPPTSVSQVPPLPANASASDRVRHFIALHHAKMCDGDLDGRTADYGAIVSVAGKDMSREQMRERDAATWAQAARVAERIDGPISVTAQQNNRHHCEYGILFEFERRDGFTESGAALVDMDVLLTALGPKIVSKRIRIYKSNPTRRK